MSKRVLGKGIDALFQSTQNGQAAPGTVLKMVGVDRIRPNPNQPRTEFREEPLRELADSIRENGVIQPIIVEESEGGYLVVAGERRFRAAKLAGLAELPVIVRSFSEEEKIEIALVENVQREDLTPIEEARAYRSLIEASGLNQEALAARIGRNRSTVANSLRLLKLPGEIQDALQARDLSAGHARAILSVLNPADQQILFKRIMASGLSVREAEDMSADLNKGVRVAPPKREKPTRVKSPELADIEQRLINRLGTKVAVRGGTNRGRIEISYFSADDLDRVFDLLVSD